MPEIGRLLRALGGAIDSTGRTNALNLALLNEEKEQKTQEQERQSEEDREQLKLLKSVEVQIIDEIRNTPSESPRFNELQSDLKIIRSQMPGIGNLDIKRPSIGSRVKTESRKNTFVVSGGDDLNKQFNLGIPENERARVEFELDEQGNPVNASVLGRFGAATKIENKIDLPKGESKFQEELGKSLANQIKVIRESGESASNIQPELIQLKELASTQDFQTGSLQPFITSIQGFADDIGIDINDAAKSIGIDNLGKLQTKEQANRLFNRVVLDNFEKIKGNLNAQEVKIAKSTFGDIGDSEEANIDAIAALMASNQIARETAAESFNIKNQADANKLLKQKNQRGTNRFTQLKDQFKQDMLTKRNLDRSVQELTDDEIKAELEIDG